MSGNRSFAVALVSQGAPTRAFNFFRSPVYVTALVVDRATGKVYYQASAQSDWTETAGGSGGGGSGGGNSYFPGGW